MQKLITGIWLFLLISVAGAEQEFLKPEQAFVMSATADGNTIKVRWNIADGYYLYKSKFRFNSANKEIALEEPRLPEGIIKQDPIFGNIEVFRNQVEIAVPISTSGILPDMLEIEARSQGCADAGICYPPRTQTVLVALNEAADEPIPVTKEAIADMQEALAHNSGSGADSASTSSGEPDADPGISPLESLGAFGDILGLGEDDILPPDQAFKFSAEVADGRNLHLRWDIAETTYLYKEKLSITLEADGIELGSYELPQPKIKKNSIKPDGSLGDVPVYYNNIDLVVPLIRDNVEATEVTLKTKYQGCADRGICYPPQKHEQRLQLPAVSVQAAGDEPATIQAAREEAIAPSAETEDLSEQDQIAAMLASGSTWLIVASFFGIGLLLAFTPCVFPMIPILSGIIAGQGTSITTRKAFWLSLVYVLAMAVTYTIAGVLAGLFGANLQATFQDPWILSAFAAVFILLALSMFGFYELQLPSSWQAKLSEISNRQQGGHLTGAAIMGLLSALIVGPCVAPPLAGALIFIGQTGDGMLGGIALFAMAMGMGAPLVAIGTSAGKLLPKAGAWMDVVKAVFGVFMLGLAIYLLERIIPEPAAMGLWGLLFVVSAVYMGAIQQLPVEASGWNKLWKGIGVALLVYGSLFLIGAAAGGKDTLQPLRGIILGGDANQAAHLAFKRIKTTQDLERELEAAKLAGKPVMLDFYADWCVYCKQMEKNTFPDPAVQTALSHFVLLQADVTAQDDADLALQEQIGIPAPPAMIFWDAAGIEHRNLRLLGYMDAEEFAAHVARL